MTFSDLPARCFAPAPRPREASISDGERSDGAVAIASPAGSLDIHNDAVVTLLALCRSNHRESYFDIVMVDIVGALLGLAAVIALDTAFGSF